MGPALLALCSMPVLLPAALPATAALPYMDPLLDPLQRAKDLVARLSLEDQVGLLLRLARSSRTARAEERHRRERQQTAHCPTRNARDETVTLRAGT